jgi:hypothetical protein
MPAGSDKTFDDAEAWPEDPPRRRWPLFAVAGLLLLASAAYSLSPLVAAVGFLDDARRGDSAAIAARVDFPRLRRSIARQIVSDQVRERNLGGIEAQLARGAGTRTVAAWLEDVLTPQAVIDLASGRTPAGVASAGAPLDIRPAAPGAPAQPLAIWRASGFTGIDSYRLVPRPEAGEEGGALEMTLTGFSWRITGAVLPPALRAEIARRAQEIASRPQ